jgi:RHS repeat-associated protein
VLAAKEKHASLGATLPQAETRVWGVTPENEILIGACSQLSSTLRWGCWHIYAGTASGGLVNRYYSNGFGRFMTPDPYKGISGGSGDPDNPQSWNKYAYTVGDPVNWIDPDGQFYQPPQQPPNQPLPPIVNSNQSGSPNPGGTTKNHNGAPPNPITHLVRTATQAIQALDYAIQNLGKNCLKILPSVSTLQSDAQDLTFWDSRLQGSLPVAFIPGVVASTPGQTLASALQQNGGTANAVTLLGPNGTISPNVDLGLGFFIQVSYAVQGTMLLHELLHYATQEGDSQIDQTYGITVQGIGNNPSAAFESWLENDCNNPSN